MLAAGTLAPDFELKSDSGELVQLSSLRGQPVVLYFYPMDATPGCTRQACGIRDAWAAFEERGAVVLGVSPDDESSHADFKSEFSLPFTLLADPGHDVADAYGVWIERTIAGAPVWGNQRSTFVIDADGVLSAVMREVDPDQHTADVLAALDR